mmetsp:Transcript_110788/g.357499  ORF Transcript_110788/g.357499 Transcript_110788/m.357499 type:complete len:389 (+) Transcript_110788:71-1237(+)
MTAVPYTLMQDRLSNRGSFVLCDCGAIGFPIRYASMGFSDLFGYTPAEWTGRRCGDLVAEAAIRAHDPELRALAAVAEMGAADVDIALKAMTRFAAQECRRMMARPNDGMGTALVLNRSKKGKLKVIELVMLVCRHPRCGWPYSVGLQTDITKEVSVSMLLRALFDGNYTALLRQQEPGLQGRLRTLDIRSAEAQRYLDLKASEMWESLLLDALRESAKALRDMSSTCGFSLGKAPTSEDSCSYREELEDEVGGETEDVVETPSMPDTVADAIGPLRPTPAQALCGVRVRFGRSVSEASTTGVPDGDVQAFSRWSTEESSQAFSRLPTDESAGQPTQTSWQAAPPRQPQPPPCGEAAAARGLWPALGVGLALGGALALVAVVRRGSRR